MLPVKQTWIVENAEIQEEDESPIKIEFSNKLSSSDTEKEDSQNIIGIAKMSRNGPFTRNSELCFDKQHLAKTQAGKNDGLNTIMTDA